MERENKAGFQLGESNRSSEDDPLNKVGAQKKLGAGLDKKSSDDGIVDNYEDDFDDDIEEDLPDQHDELHIEDEAAARNQPAAVSGSGQGITVS